MVFILFFFTKTFQNSTEWNCMARLVELVSTDLSSALKASSCCEYLNNDCVIVLMRTSARAKGWEIEECVRKRKKKKHWITSCLSFSLSHTTNRAEKSCRESPNLSKKQNTVSGGLAKPFLWLLWGFFCEPWRHQRPLDFSYFQEVPHGFYFTVMSGETMVNSSTAWWFLSFNNLWACYSLFTRLAVTNELGKLKAPTSIKLSLDMVRTFPNKTNCNLEFELNSNDWIGWVDLSVRKKRNVQLHNNLLHPVM